MELTSVCSTPLSIAIEVYSRDLSGTHTKQEGPWSTADFAKNVN